MVEHIVDNVVPPRRLPLGAKDGRVADEDALQIIAQGSVGALHDQGSQQGNGYPRPAFAREPERGRCVSWVLGEPSLQKVIGVTGGLGVVHNDLRFAVGVACPHRGVYIQGVKQSIPAKRRAYEVPTESLHVRLERPVLPEHCNTQRAAWSTLVPHEQRRIGHLRLGEPVEDILSQRGINLNVSRVLCKVNTRLPWKIGHKVLSVWVGSYYHPQHYEDHGNM
mmetsp:Transcript_27823/g.77832  ORF Transcript_27823/g.77832 Transcript_27823/m.77832 type:complete len:222 (-) Transcript_27823:56-721(-)